MTLLAPSDYTTYLPVIDRVFGMGIDAYVRPTGFDAYRFITGFGGSITDIKPLWTPGNPARGLVSGNNRLFTADQRSTALAEVFGHTGDGTVVAGSYELQFSVTGQTLNHSLVADPEYRELFRKSGDHIFSQCVDYYMETGGYARQFDTHSWLTVAGEAHGISGYIHGWKQNRGAIHSTKILPYHGG
jgi:hypothetical protein